MADCGCCITLGTQVLVGQANISKYTISVAVDTTREILWEPTNTGDCIPDYNSPLYLYGPGKSVLQLSAYPWSNTAEEYSMGFLCPMDVNLQVGWKYVFDCRNMHECIDFNTGNKTLNKVRGRWVGIPMKKKNITVTGGQESDLFVFKGCSTPAAKFNIQAGPHAAMTPQVTRQYSGMEYKGLPIAFDTDNIKKKFNLTIESNEYCQWTSGFKDVEALLTGFTFSFQPPAPPVVTYNFEAVLSICPEC
jgi:hypothetical protein